MTSYIQASVGMHRNGTVACFNLPVDVKTVVELLNVIGPDQGGKSFGPLPLPVKSPKVLFEAIREFQRKQNEIGNKPLLSVDGHVDPNGSTLRRLSDVASLLPLGANEGSFPAGDNRVGPTSPRSPTSPVSTRFKIRFLGGLSASGFGAAGDELFFQIWDTTNNLILTFMFTGGGAGIGLPFLPLSVTKAGPFTSFFTSKPVPVEDFAGPAAWSSHGGGPFTRNKLQMFGIAGRGLGVSTFVETGFTVGVGLSTTFGNMNSMTGVLPFSGP